MLVEHMGQQVSLFSDDVLRGPIGEEEVSRLRERALECKQCRLSQSRNRVVFGVGNADQPKLAFVGEGPGRTEDQRGEPFVGPSGRLLNRMIRAIGLARDDVYICNAINCMPPEEKQPDGRMTIRKPHSHEVAACQGFLFGQLRAVRPQCVVVLGAFAARGLLGAKVQKISSLLGKWHEWEGVPVRATYHPAYLLREPSQKSVTWEDLQAVMLKLGIVKN